MVMYFCETLIQITFFAYTIAFVSKLDNKYPRLASYVPKWEAYMYIASFMVSFYAIELFRHTVLLIAKIF